MALSAAIILAAGEGTRMRSNKPKVLHTLAGKTFLNRVMDSVAALDPDTLAVVVHYQAERVAEAARSYNEHVTIVDQDDIPGTGRAVQCAMAQLTQKDDLDGAVLIAASDMPLLDTDTLDQLLAFHEKSGNGATVLTTILDDPTGYGRIIRDSEGNVLRIVEQKDANSSELAVREVNTSVYVFDAKLLAEAIANLKSNNAQGEFYLTDALEAAKANGAVGAFAAPDPLSVEGVNDRVQLAALAKAHNKRVCEHWMREGVTILDPDTTWIEDDVQIARDAVILPGCFLQGHTVIGEAAEVGPYTTLIGATIDAEAHVERSRVQETHIGRAANIGPEMNPDRQVLPGLFYRFPAAPDKVDPFTVEREMFSRLAAVAGEDMPADKWLVDTFNGISPLVAREIAFRACGAVDAPAPRTAETLWAAFSVWRDTVNANNFTPVMLKRSGAPMDFTYLPVCQYGSAAAAEEYGSFSALLDNFYAKREQADRVKQKGQDLLKTANNAAARLRRKITMQEKELLDSKDRDKWRRHAVHRSYIRKYME